MLAYFLAVGSLTGFGGVIFLNRTAIAKGLDGWHVLPQPERLSELYFTRPRELPESLTPGNPQKISFTVRNLEHRTSTYRFAVTAMSEESGTDYPLGEGVFTLDHDRSQAIDQDVALPALSGRMLLKISLRYEGLVPGSSVASPQSQSIYYWATATAREKEAPQR